VQSEEVAALLTIETIEAMKSVRTYAGRSSAGEAVHENLLVDELSSNLFKLRASPGLVLGLAKGDVFKLDAKAEPVVIQRGGNIAIQIYQKKGAANQHRKIEETILDSLSSSSLDGITEQQLVFTVPASEGFPKIEGILNALVSDYPGYEWYFGNVYEPADGITPLNWWRARGREKEG